MGWTAPKTWVDNELVTAGDLNLQLRDNLGALKNPPSAQVWYAPSPALQITSTSFVDIHSSLSFSLNTNGGALMYGLTGRVYHNPGSNMDCSFDILVDGGSESGGAGFLWLLGPSTWQFPFSGIWLLSAKPAGAHTIKLQCKRGSGNSNPLQIWTLQAWVREVS